MNPQLRQYDTPRSLRFGWNAAGVKHVESPQATEIHHARCVHRARLAIELLTAAQAIDLRLRNEGKGVELLGSGTRQAFLRLRETIPFLDTDRPLAPDIEQAAQLMQSRELMRGPA